MVPLIHDPLLNQLLIGTEIDQFCNLVLFVVPIPYSAAAGSSWNRKHFLRLQGPSSLESVTQFRVLPSGPKPFHHPAEVGREICDMANADADTPWSNTLIQPRVIN